MTTMTFIDDIVKVINAAADVQSSSSINKKSTDDMFNGLLATVPDPDPNMDGERFRAVWENNLRFGEDEWCEQEYGDLKDKAQHQGGKRAGEWKYRTILPNPYTSAKNVIGKALERGVDVRGKGKSAIQKESKEAANGGEESLDNAGKFAKLIDKAVELMEESENAIQEKMFDYVRAKFAL